jgi:hypothetical protein
MPYFPIYRSGIQSGIQFGKRKDRDRRAAWAFVGKNIGIRRPYRCGKDQFVESLRPGLGLEVRSVKEIQQRQAYHHSAPIIELDEKSWWLIYRASASFGLDIEPEDWMHIFANSKTMWQRVSSVIAGMKWSPAVLSKSRTERRDQCSPYDSYLRLRKEIEDSQEICKFDEREPHEN